MATQFPDLFAGLAAPFAADEVRSRSQAGRQFHYITARHAMNRLDNILGPENWWDEYVASESSVLCRLTIRLPDGSTLTKSDAGGYAGMTDEGDDDKSGYSDAFKRACAKFGVARYLYRDGVPTFARDAAPPPPSPPPAPPQAPAPPSRADHPAPANGDPPAGWEPDGSIRLPGSGKGLYAAAKEQEQKHGASFIAPINAWSKARGLPGKMVDWAGDDLRAGWRFLCWKVQGISGPAVAVADVKAANGNGNGALKKSLIEKVRKWYGVVYKHDPDNDRIKAKIDEVYASLWQGEVIDSLATFADHDRLVELDKVMGVLLAEVQADDDIPF